MSHPFHREADPAAFEPAAAEAPPQAAGGRRRRMRYDVPRAAVVGLFVLALLGALYVARVVVLPIVLAVMLGLLLAPAVRFLRRLHVPRWIAAGVVVAGLVAVVGGGVYYLASPAADWMDRAPRSLRKLEAKVRQIKEPVAKVNRATQEVERITDVGGKKTREVEVAGKSLSGNLMDFTATVASAGAVMLVLLYFLLASGDVFLRKAAGVLPTQRHRTRMLSIARRVEHSISMYLFTITLINTCLGILVGLGLWWLDMPNPVLWGVMAGLLNFVPYLGAVVGVSVVALVALLTFDSVGAALAPPALYLTLTAIEGSFVTPTIVGRRLTLNPLIIFVGIIFWGWMWGVVGALLAVPLIATVKIVCDHVEPLKPWGELLGGVSRPTGRLATAPGPAAPSSSAARFPARAAPEACASAARAR